MESWREPPKFPFPAPAPSLRPHKTDLSRTPQSWLEPAGPSRYTAAMSRHPQPVDLAATKAAVTAPYWNGALAAVNDHEIRMSVMTHAFGWHLHPDSDETFLAVEGRLVITLEDGEVVLSPGEMFTVERGVVHRTRPEGARSVNLTFERKGAETVFVSPEP